MISSQHRNRVAFAAVVMAAALAGSSSRAASISCNGLGFLASDGVAGTWSAAEAVSADGAVVVGYDVGAGDIGYRAFRWTAGEGMQPLNLRPDGGAAFESVASRVSADGKVVVGWMRDRKGAPLKAFRWTRETGMEDIGRLPGVAPIIEATAAGVSGDGAVVVGDNQQAFRWTRDGGIQPLGAFLGPLKGSTAQGISSDGTTIVGASTNADRRSEAFRWRAGGGMQGLGFLSTQGSEPHSRGEAVSANGSVVVGSSSNAGGYWEPFRWTPEQGMQSLGYIGKPAPLGSFHFESSAFAVSADGKVVVGDSVGTDGDYQPFLWTEAGGMQGLGRILGGRSIGEEIGRGGARGINADGSVIVGSAPNQTRGIEAFLCTVR